MMTNDDIAADGQMDVCYVKTDQGTTVTVLYSSTYIYICMYIFPILYIYYFTVSLSTYVCKQYKTMPLTKTLTNCLPVCFVAFPIFFSFFLLFLSFRYCYYCCIVLVLVAAFCCCCVCQIFTFVFTPKKYVLIQQHTLLFLFYFIFFSVKTRIQLEQTTDRHSNIHTLPNTHTNILIQHLNYKKI